MSNNSATPLVVYGIRNCDSCRNALKWLEAQKVPFSFHDFRLDGLDKSLLEGWLESPQASRLLNKRSTSWRKLSDEQKLVAENQPLSLLLEHPTLIKRPVITDGDCILDVGFSPTNMKHYI